MFCVGGGFDIAGSTIARAVRLEAKAPRGGVLIDVQTFNRLRADLKARFGSKQNVHGKHVGAQSGEGC